MRTRAITVATDGTDSSKAVVEWAAREAQRRQLPLRIVHVYDWEPDDAAADIGGEYLDIARSLADAVSASAVDQARAVAPTLEIDRETLIGRVTARLLTESEGAELLVLGSRGRGGFAGLRLGSVSRRVATHAACPVVVVHGDVPPEGPVEGSVDGSVDGPVAVGVDDSAGADHVLEVAFAEAAAHECALAVVRSYLPALPLWLADDVRADDVDTPEQDEVERARLAELLAPWREKYPEVPVEVVLTHAGPAAALVGVSSRARMVIVGSRGRGVLTGALLGSTGLQLLHHASCPVYLVRPQPADGVPR
jgi:nucleotide-binding universal stress UspA family protein